MTSTLPDEVILNRDIINDDDDIHWYIIDTYLLTVLYWPIILRGDIANYWWYDIGRYYSNYYWRWCWWPWWPDTLSPQDVDNSIDNILPHSAIIVDDDIDPIIY